MNDFMDEVMCWLHETYGLETAAVEGTTAGLCVGLALAARHPEYAAVAHERLGIDYRVRATTHAEVGGSVAEFELMASAITEGGDGRTAPEKMADECVEACPVPT